MATWPSADPGGVPGTQGLTHIAPGTPGASVLKSSPLPLDQSQSVYAFVSPTGSRPHSMRARFKDLRNARPRSEHTPARRHRDSASPCSPGGVLGERARPKSVGSAQEAAGHFHYVRTCSHSRWPPLYSHLRSPVGSALERDLCRSKIRSPKASFQLAGAGFRVRLRAAVRTRTHPLPPFSQAPSALR